MNDRPVKRDREEALTLEILEAVETRSDLTQRHLARQLGVALGLANSYLRRCVRKGLIKIQQAPANRYLYYLTPKGFAEKSRLTGEYLVSSFDYYNRAGVSVVSCYRQMLDAGRRRVLFAGLSELAEIAYVRAHDFDLEVVGTWDAASRSERFVGRPVWRELSRVDPFEAVLLTDLAHTAATFAVLRATVAAERVYVPDIVRSVLETERVAPDGDAEPSGTRATHT